MATAKVDGFGNGSGKEQCILGHQGHLTAQLRRTQLAQVLAVQQNAPLLGNIEAEQQGKQGGLASP